MRKSQTTRRGVLRGAGVVGLTGLVGAATAQQTPTTQADTTAVRVSHASPDAPPVSVVLDGETVLESLSYGSVSDYSDVEPGEYQLQIVPAGEGGFLGGVLEDLFGSTTDGETVLYDQQITVEEGTTYTAVAFGQASEGPVAGATPEQEGTTTPTDAATPTPTGTATATPVTQDFSVNQLGQPGTTLIQGLTFGESVDVDVDAGEYTLLVRPTAPGGMVPGVETTPNGGTESTPPEGTTTPAESTGFQVTILEDDLSSPAEGQSRIRVFHAVPDAGDVTILAVPQGQGQDQGQGQGQDQVRQVDVSLESGTVYSGFAIGYFAPEETTPGEATPEETTPQEQPEFELVVVETSIDGERANGGTGG